MRSTASITTFASLLLGLLAWGTFAHGLVLETAGETYAIAEPDALEEIRQRAAGVDWREMVSEDLLKQKVRDFRPAGLHRLPAAKRSRSFPVDMTYTLDRDIPDGRGGFLYRRGYTFNPLEYVRLTSVLVVIDGSDPRQVEWFRRSPYAEDFRTRLILSDGDYQALSEDLRRPVFYLMEPMAARLRLQAVPAVIYQQGRFLEVNEIAIETD